MAKNPKFYQRTKHIDVRYYYIRELVEKKQIELFYIPTDENVADGLTKPLDITKH